MNEVISLLQDILGELQDLNSNLNKISNNGWYTLKDACDSASSIESKLSDIQLTLNTME